MSIVVWAQVTVFTHVMSYDVDWDRLGTMGRAFSTKETQVHYEIQVHEVEPMLGVWP